MVTSLNKFRTQYPEGGLVSELVSIHDGQYIVRAVVSHKGTTLASGLANSVDVQIAEDKARDRALAVLGIFADGLQPSSPPATPAPISAPISTPTDKTNDQTPQKNDATVEKEPVSEVPATEVPAAEAPVAEDEEDLGPPIDEVKEEPPTPPENKVSAATIALENFNTSAVPVDLSDVIAQTDVELTRLGWTSTQGREYLEQTYGKRSRQQLTDEELMSFLLYLEEQT